MSRLTTCINDTGGIAVVVVTGGKFRGEPSGNKFRNLVHQICGLTKFVIFADLLHVWQFANLQFVDPILFGIC
jgi:hypothetical protein